MSTTAHAIDDFYRDRSGAMIALACRYTRSQAVAEELVQDAFSRLVQRWDTVDNPAAYLRTSVVNACRDWHRSEVRLRTALATMKAEVHCDPDVDDTVGRVVAQLSQREQQVLTLRYLEDRSEHETARTLGTSRGTVKSTAHNGLRKLRTLIAEPVAATAG